MIPIHELLSRIRWNREYSKADFKIGYYDRLEDTVVTVSLKKISFQPDNHFSFELYDDSAKLHTVPLHRIRKVYRNGELIWERKSG
jgi:uncharacterized protein (UPF0248 family)